MELKTDISYVYGLFSSRDSVIRYIGYSYQPKERLSDHIKESRRLMYHRHKWIQKEILEGFKINYNILGLAKNENIGELETKFIKEFKQKGFNLVNGNEGGKGGLFNPTPEVRAKLRETKLGNSWNIGLKRSEETVQKIKDKLTGQKRTPEQVERIRLSQIGNIAPKYKNRLLTEETLIEIFRLYNEFKTVKEVSKILNLPKSNVTSVLYSDYTYVDLKTKHNLKINRVGVGYKEQGKLNTQKRLLEIESKRQIKVLKMKEKFLVIENLKKEGLSLKEISKHFNDNPRNISGFYKKYKNWMVGQK